MGSAMGVWNVLTLLSPRLCSPVRCPHESLGSPLAPAFLLRRPALASAFLCPGPACAARQLRETAKCQGDQKARQATDERTEWRGLRLALEPGPRHHH